MNLIMFRIALFVVVVFFLTVSVAHPGEDEDDDDKKVFAEMQKRMNDILADVKKAFARMIARMKEYITDKGISPFVMVSTTEVSVYAEPEPTPAKCKGFRWEWKCFWLKRRNFLETVSLGKAKSMCKRDGGKIADIYSEEHFDKAIEYIKPLIFAGPDQRAWLGMIYNAKTDVLTYSDGGNVTYSYEGLWKEGYPVKRISFDTMSIHVAREADGRQGLANVPGGVGGVLCEA